MGNTRYVLFVMSVLLCMCAPLQAQEDEVHEDLKTFFSRNTPALLFEVDALDLKSYNGGIGVMFPGTETFQWRISVGPSLSSMLSEGLEQDTVYGRRNRDNFRINVEIAPIWVLGTYGRIAMTASPVLGYSYSKTTDENQNVFPHAVLVTHVSTEYAHRALAGARLGAGVALTEAIFLLAEYQLLADYLFDSDETIRYYDEGRVTESRVELWTIGHYMTFSLGVRL